MLNADFIYMMLIIIAILELMILVIIGGKRKWLKQTWFLNVEMMIE